MSKYTGKRKRGNVLPGYNYIGPGNPLDAGKLADEDDAIAMEHDYAYQDYIDKGEDPYWNYNEADERAREQFGHGYGGYLGKAFFTAKKGAAKIGLIGTLPKMTRTSDDRRDKRMSLRREKRAHTAFRGPQETPMKPVTNLRSAPTPVPSDGPAMDPEEHRPDGEGGFRDDTGGDMDTSEATNLRSGEPGGRMGSHGETGIDAWRNAKLTPFPKTVNTILPYYINSSGTLANVDTETGQFNFTMRLNSIWDILTNRTHSENPTVVADSADGTVQVPIMRQFWIQLYDYWTVVQCTYKVRFWSENTGTDEINIFEYKHGMQTPPVVDGASTTGNLLHKKYRLMHPNMRCKTLRLRPAATTEENPFDKAVVFDGMYHAGETYNHVAEDELAQTWHKQAAVPPQREQATYIVQRSERSSRSGNVVIKYDVEVVFHVQWKDLRAQVEYPYPSAALTFTNFPVQGN